MINLRSASPVGRDEGGRLYMARKIIRGIGRNSDVVARRSPRHKRAARLAQGNS